MPDATRLQITAPPPLPGSPPRRMSQVTRRHRSADTISSRPASALPIEILIGIYRVAERGNPERQCDLFEQLAEFDGHLYGLLQGRNLAVSGADWTMQPGGTDAGSIRAAGDLELALRNNLGFRDMIEHQATATPFGYACSEIVWDVLDGKWMPARFVNVAHRRFAASSWERVDEIALRNGDTAESLIDLEPGRWIVNRARGRNPWTAGVMRTCAFWATFKRWSNRDWQVFGELFGLPAVVGFYPAGASPAARAALEEALQMIGEEGTVILEEGCEIVLKDSVRSGDATSVYPAQWRMFEEQMSKAVNGGTLTTDAGSVGSYAQASTHENRSFALTVADAGRIEETITRDLCVPFVTWNGYGGARPPRLKFQIVREQSLLVQAHILQALSTAFGPAFAVAADQVAEVFGWRIPRAGEASLAPPKPEPKAPPPGAGGGATPTKAELLAMLAELNLLGSADVATLERILGSIGVAR